MTVYHPYDWFSDPPLCPANWTLDTPLTPTDTINDYLAAIPCALILINGTTDGYIVVQ